jgi:hypothetical protein
MRVKPIDVLKELARKECAELLEEISRAIGAAIVIVPPHECCAYIEHNVHKAIYETVSDAARDAEFCDDFIKGDLETAKETNECWSLHVYPNTPIGFYRINAASTRMLNLAALEILSYKRKG